MTYPLPFDPPAFAREIEAAALDGDWTIHRLTPAAAGPRPWLHRAAHNFPHAPKVYISSGIHGDEISGPFAILEMLRQPDFFRGYDVTLFPILNPDGLLKELRENAGGIDLNRDYRGPKSAEISGHIEVLQTLGQFDAAMMLHEDYEGQGAYLFELKDQLRPTLGANIIAAMGRHVPVDTRPTIDDFPAHGGVISRDEIMKLRGPIEDRPDWPEAVYLSLNHTKVSYTTETPKPFHLTDRVAAQIAAVRILLHALNTKETGVT